MFSFENLEIEKDKANHFVYGSVMTLVTIVIGIGLLYSFIVCLAIALLKEVWDHYYGSGFDLMDIIWTILGCGVVIIPLIY